MHTFTIPEENIPKLKEKFTKLAKRAAKLGITPPTYIILGNVKKSVDGGIVLCKQVAIPDCVTPVRLDGFTFIATIQHTDTADNIINSRGAEVPLKYRTARACEHCGLTRNRKNTYLVQHDDGEYKQVGHDCMADFLGNDALLMAGRAEFYSTLGHIADELTEGGTNKWRDLENYLSYVAEVIKTNGWVSKKNANASFLISTSDLAYGAMTHGETEPSQDSLDIAQAAIDWAANLDGDIEEYLHNLRTLAQNGVFEDRNTGLAGSMIAAYRRAMGMSVRWGKKSTSQFVGNVDRPIEIKVTVEGVTPVTSRFGVSNLIKMIDAEGNLLSAFSAGAFVPETQKDYIVKGMVKKHEEFAGTSRTVLKYCKFAEV